MVNKRFLQTAERWMNKSAPTERVQPVTPTTPTPTSSQGVNFPDSPNESFIFSYDHPQHKDFFQELIGYDTVKAPKKATSADYFKGMLRVIDTIPERIIFVGDSIEEANLTTELGMSFVLVWRRPNSKPIGIQKVISGIIHDLTELLPIIKSL